jgi:molybdopterin-guanine dinucleotide biosynthesis protein A
VNAYILVGGRSRRMGASKTELFLDRVVAAAAPVFDEVLAVNRHDAEPLPIRTIFEELHEGEGALHGVARALADARARCFIIAVDFPLVTTNLLQFLALRFEECDAPLLVPEWDGVAQPLCAGWNAPSVLPLVERRLAEGNLEVRSLIVEAGAAIIPERELRARFSGEPLMNVNTPEQRAEAERWYG